MPLPPVPPFPIPGAVATANDIIKRAMRMIGVLASGETPTAAEANDALVILNQMLDSWNAERLMIFTLTRSEFPLVPGQQTYTIGTGAADFQVVRPPRIEYAFIISLANPAQPLELPMDMLTDRQWADIPVKNISSSLPLAFYDDGGFPNRGLNYFPIPNTAVNTALWTWTPLNQFQALTTVNSFPPGYLECLAYQLAPRLAPEFGASTPPEVVVMAVQAMARIKGYNIPILDLQCDPAIVGTASQGRVFNWLTGDWQRSR